LIDDEGLSARIAADHLGHAQVSMTQDRYMARGRVHTEVAAMLDRVINDE
jgi:integrase